MFFHMCVTSRQLCQDIAALFARGTAYDRIGHLEQVRVVESF